MDYNIIQPREQHYYDGFLKLTVKYINSTKLRNVFVRRIRDDDDTDDEIVVDNDEVDVNHDASRTKLATRTKKK